MMSEPMIQPGQAVGAGHSPGQLLRAARENKQLTIEQVARRLYLPEQTIRALEDDDLSRLPHPTFVRGYLRNYAKLVGIPERDVHLEPLESVPQLEEQPVIEDETLAQGPGAHFTGLWVLGPVVLVVAIAWWVKGNFDAEPAPQAPTADLAPTASQPATAAEKAASAEAFAQLDRKVPEPAPSELVPALFGDPLPSTRSEPNLDVPEEVAAGARSSAPVSSWNVPAGVPSSGPRTVSVGTDAPATGAAAAPHVLQLNFTGNSWATVVDGSGVKLMHEMGRQGMQKALKGEPPLMVTLSHPGHVALALDGEPYDYPQKDSTKPAAFIIEPVTAR